MLYNLTDLWIFNNPIENLDLSNNPKLISLWAYGCALKSLNIKGTATNRNGVPQMCITKDNPSLLV